MESSKPGGPDWASSGAGTGPAESSPHTPPPPAYERVPGQPEVHDAASSSPNSAPHRHDGRPRGGVADRARRAGAGGRWWLWLGRAVLWALILVVIFNGVRAPFVRALQPSAQPQETHQGGSGYPADAASAYALRFAHVYLDTAPGAARKRAIRLEEYLPADADPQLGWDGAGRLRLEAAHVAGVNARDEHHGVVKLAVRAGGRWMRLSVPVYVNDRGAMVISGRPAFFPAAGKAALPDTGEQSRDTEAEAELRRQLPGFFEAYAGNDAETLGRYTAPGVALTGFTGAVRFVSLDDVVVPDEPGPARVVTTTVTWELVTDEGDAAGKLQQTYQLTVTNRGDRWDVEQIRGAPSAGFS